MNDKSERRKIALVMFHRIGPYHLARLRALAKASSLKIVALEATDNDDIYEWDSVSQLDIEKITIFPGVKATKVSRSELLKRLKEIFIETNPEVVALQGWTHLGLAGLLAASRLSVPTILMSESSANDFDRNVFKEWIKRKVVKASMVGLVGGITHRHYLEKLGMPKENIFFGYDVIDNAHFQLTESEIMIAKQLLKSKYGVDRNFFLGSCRFIAKKNLMVLLEAYRRYREVIDENPCDLVIIGDGELMGELKKFLEINDLKSCIHLPGFIQYNELPLFYTVAECFVHVPIVEQWGLVVNEALASGLPVILSNSCGSAHELIDEGDNGWLINPRDIASVTSTMCKFHYLNTDKKMQMSKIGKEIVSRWDTDRFALGFNEAMDKIHNQPLKKLSIIETFVLRIALSRV